ncbi:MAG: hypothetical protein JSW64_05635 [Candidatus Zixiibacteriota bacterium]|nr:MAG: hypothetical protein JSW64_05635 [candidate division Zixibacteria bacterium]
MNLFKIPLVKVIGLLALAMLLAAGCTETPEEPEANVNPNTFITSYEIGISPDSSTYYSTTVYWRASDPDGEPLWYIYEMEDDTGGVVISLDTTFNTSVNMSLNFPTGTEVYTFTVWAEDNEGDPDPTPAAINIAMTTVRSLDEFVPNTNAITVPPNGASTSQGVPFAIGGDDVDGIVTIFEWAIDDVSHDTMWTAVAPDVITVSSSSVVITLTPTELSLGPHTVYFRAIDNAGNPDPSPLSVSIVCEAGYEPELSLSVADGFNFVVPYTDPVIAEIVIEMTALVDFYYGQIVNFDIITSQGDDTTVTENSFTFTDLSSGDYWIKVTANDAGGNSVTDSTNFGVVELAAGDGVLCINGVDWETYGEAVEVWEAGAYWGNRTHFKIWDLFADAPAGGDYADSLLGSGTPPLWIIDTLFFDAIVWAYNSYSGDNDYWEDEDMQAAIMAFLESGGSLLIMGRYGAFIFEDGSQEFADYVQYSSAVVGLTPGFLDAIHSDFTDITVRTSSSSWTDAITIDHPTTIEIYTDDGGMPGFGWIIEPNGADAGGKVAFIAGRHYRFTIAELQSNVDVILADYFGIEN